MTKTYAELQALCIQHDHVVPSQRRPAKEPYILALRDHFWASDNPGVPLPAIEPMLLANWSDLDEEDADRIQQDDSGWPPFEPSVCPCPTNRHLRHSWMGFREFMTGAKSSVS